jgi:hypothetical protein
MSATNTVKQTARQAAFSPMMENLARVGYAVRGVIYFTMGLLAVDVTLGKRGAPADQTGAIAEIGRQPAGELLLWIILVGLVSYALWGVVRAVFDPLHKGKDTKGMVTRVGYLASAVSYAALVVPTYGLIRGTRSAGAGGAGLPMASLMAKPWGPWLVGLLGLILIGAGVAQIIQGFKATFDRQFDPYAMSAEQRKWAVQLGRFGTATRGVILGIIGGLLVLATFHAASIRQVGILAAFSTLMQQPFGIWLLGIVALGLMAFGVYSIENAVWFRLKR